MTNLLALPRELRDEVYGWVLREALAVKQSRLPRRRIMEPTESRSDDNLTSQVVRRRSNTKDDYYFDDEAVRYSVSKAIPPTQGLL